MFESIKVRAAVALLVGLIALIYLAPSLKLNIPFLPEKKINLGLDLQGGMHLILEVETEKAVESAAERSSNNLKETLMDKRIRFRHLKREAGRISMELPNREERDAFEEVLSDDYPDLEIETSETIEGREEICLRIKKKHADHLKKFAVEQCLETIRNRVDQFGVTEPEIIPQSNDRILIQLPGIKDPGRAKKLIGKTALLEFKLLDEEHGLDDALKGRIPAGSYIAYGYKVNRETGYRGKVSYLLKDKTLLTGESLENAMVRIDSRFGEPYVALKFNSQGAKDFDRITAENVKKRLAIILDGVVHSAPVIQERISGGEAQITGTFTMDEARDLAIVLRAGALPAPVRILEERTVGPSLGQDSVHQGILSIIIGGMLVIIFIAGYYKLSGIVADIALVLNIIIIMGALAAFQATLTLPGIAGIVLVIGMAVDANVLIFERIREEMRTGRTPRAAIAGGYSKAFITIIDANITTLIAALVLFQFGTGPVKGFAVTLSIGIIASMFTAIFVTRIVYDYFIWNRKIKRVSI
jgi:preprotein translocase subunit SecD